MPLRGIGHVRVNTHDCFRHLVLLILLCVHFGDQSLRELCYCVLVQLYERNLLVYSCNGVALLDRTTPASSTISWKLSRSS